MTHDTGVAALLLTAVALSGCTERPGGATAVTDSAGVEIVTNLPGSIESAEAWSLSPEPVVEIGAGASPDVALFRVTDVTPLEGGRVAVGTNVPPQALVFAADGTLASTLGREGEGPGEFASVGSVVPLGPDSLAVWDPDRRRISVFTGDGRFARYVDLSAIAPMSTRAAPNMSKPSGFIHLLPSTSGSLFVFGEGFVSASREPGIVRPELPAHRITTEGEELTTLGAFPGIEMAMGGPFGILPLPFGARTYATTANGDLVVGTADTTQYRVFSPTGALARIVRWPDHDRSVDGPFLSRWSEMVEDAPPEIRQFVETVPRRERFPAYSALVGTKAGEVLVGEYPGPVGIWPVGHGEGPEGFQPELRVPARRWLVFDPEGALLAKVSTPEGFEPYAVREGLMWGVYTNELDVESIRAYELTDG